MRLVMGALTNDCRTKTVQPTMRSAAGPKPGAANPQFRYTPAALRGNLAGAHCIAETYAQSAYCWLRQRDAERTAAIPPCTPVASNSGPAISVLVLAESLLTRDVLSNILNVDADIKLMAIVTSAAEFLGCLRKATPDVIIAVSSGDGTDGRGVADAVVETQAIPTIVVRHPGAQAGADSALEVTKAGAAAVLESPVGRGIEAHHDFCLGIRRAVHEAAHRKKGSTNGNGQAKVL